MDHAIRLRPEEPGDAAFLFRLYASTRADEMKLVPWNDAQKEAFLRMQLHAQTTHYRQQYPNASYDIILSGDVPAGRLYIDRTDEAIAIIDISLLPEHRGAGIGGSLLRRVLAEAAERRKAVHIYVEQHNPAMHLYHRLGFRKISDYGVYNFMEWKPETDAGATPPSP
ncbi:MAG TPA: GNAT family N-acetyltransferase [Candidatus Limnocylindrales bacterium]|nr:GNAT family N-acetyltransferase [Candidatus Limnocylindrales bacterium]